MRAAALAEGSVARAIALCDDGRCWRCANVCQNLLARLPDSSIRRRCTRWATASAVARTARSTTFLDAVRDWLSAQLVERGRRRPAAGAVRRGLGEVQPRRRDVEIYNLERKPLVFTAFGLLAEAARG